MFDNPRKSLFRLQQELLAEEEEPVEEADFEDPEEALDEMKEFLRREDWEESDREPLYRSYSEDDEEAEDMQYADPAELPKKELKKRRKRGNGGLIFAAVLEILGLIALLGWWLLWGM